MSVKPQPTIGGKPVLNKKSKEVTARAENDAASIVAALALGLFSTLIGLVVFAKVLSNMPSMVAAGVVFSLIVFLIVCGAAFLNADRRQVPQGPPQLQFRRPVRARRKVTKATA